MDANYRATALRPLCWREDRGHAVEPVASQLLSIHYVCFGFDHLVAVYLLTGVAYRHIKR